MSNLLEQASLVMIPSGYKEDVVYSEIPINGAGDLTFTRASDGTRINSQGLVEVVPWNLLLNTNTFSSWNLEGGTLTSGFTAPDGSSTAYKYVQIPGGGLYSGSGGVTADVKFAQVWIKSVSGGSITVDLSDGSAYFGTFNVTGEWQLFTAPYTANSRIGLYLYGISNAQGIYVWHPQINIGSTAKPYFPTTDRLNVPRLTYQNGGGGCPSLLLEKQSTNLVTYSQDFSNAAWNTIVDSGCSLTITPNYTTASNGLPATRLVASRTNTSTLAAIVNYAPNTSTNATKSIWMKNNNSGNVTIMFGDEAVTITDSWERYSVANTYVYAIIGLRYSGVALSCDISMTGYQFELGSYPTSYIPTTSSSATRVADASRTTGRSSLIGQSEGTLFLDLYYLPLQNQVRAMSITETSVPLTNRLIININNTNNRVSVISRQSGSLTNGSMGESPSTVLLNGRNKIALGYKSGDSVLYINGVQVATNTDSFTFSATLNDIFLMTSEISLVADNVGLVNISALFTTRLTNAQLTTLTTL